MIRDQLLAEAAAAEAEAETLWARIHAVQEALPADVFGRRPIVPAGMDNDAQRAGDLMRMARGLRADASEPTPKPSAGVLRFASPAERPPLANAAVPSLPARGADTPPPTPKAQSMDDPVEAVVRRILASDQSEADLQPSGDAEVDAIAARIAASDLEEADEVDVVAARIAAA